MMNTWPISVRSIGQRMLFGIPPRLGDGRSGGDVGAPALEQRVGDDWLEQLLGVLLPKDRAWLWWTRSDVFAKTGLQAERAPSAVELQRTHAVLRRNLWLRRMSIVFVPAQHSVGQRAVVEWAGMDTDHVADHLWTAPADAREWDLDAMSAWCSDAEQWQRAETIATLPAERVITLSGGYLFCALSLAEGERLKRELSRLAQGWGVEVIEGAVEDAWVRE